MILGTVVWAGEFINIPNAMWTLIETVEPRENPDDEESNGIKYGKQIGTLSMAMVCLFQLDV